MKIKFRHFLIGLTLLTLSTTLTAAAFASNLYYELPRWTVDNGGGRSDEGAYVLQGIIGQYDTGRSSRGAYYLQGGFWAGPQSELPPTEFTLYLPLARR
jgi:hypothetical protein